MVLYIILGLIALIFVVALAVGKDMNYEKSVLINGSKEKVWKHVGTLTAMDQWSPWNARDPNMKSELTGTDGEPGAKQSWVSDVKNVGEGNQTIIAVDAMNRLDTKLNFIKPFKSTADAYVTLESESDKVKATWGFKSQMPYPMNIMKLFMNFEKNMDKDFGDGLNKLKNLSEQK